MCKAEMKKTVVVYYIMQLFLRKLIEIFLSGVEQTSNTLEHLDARVQIGDVSFSERKLCAKKRQKQKRVRERERRKRNKKTRLSLKCHWLCCYCLCGRVKVAPPTSPSSAPGICTRAPGPPVKAPRFFVSLDVSFANLQIVHFVVTSFWIAVLYRFRVGI